MTTPSARPAAMPTVFVVDDDDGVRESLRWLLESVGLRSKKKLEKAARFGGRNKLPQQPLGPMRSATEHEAIWTGAPADAGMSAGLAASPFAALIAELIDGQF